MEINDRKKNCTTIFLLPGIGLFRKDILKYGFLSAYLDDIDHEPHYSDSVYLLFRPEERGDFQEFLKKEYRRSAMLVEDYDHAGGFVVLVYNFPKEFKTEFEHFLSGEYSKFSKDYISLFPERVETTDKSGEKVDEVSLQYHIFARTDAIKKYWESKIGSQLPKGAELWSAPDFSQEVLDINNL